MKKLAFVLMSCLFVSATLAQTNNSIFLNKMEGVWVGKGTAMGATSNVTMEWGKALGHKFYRINYTMQMSFNGGEQVFEGMGLYKLLKEGGYEGTWFDSGGEMLPIKSSDDGKTLTSFWGRPSEKYGKTEYEFIDDKTIEVRDATQNKDGSWRPFAKSTLTKKGN